MPEEKQIEFSKLKHAYLAVRTFLEDYSCGEIIPLGTKIVDDLRLIGDDNYCMLVEFIKKFELKYIDFNYDQHFHHETELFDLTAALYNIVVILIWLPLKAIELLTFNNLKITKPGFYKPVRKVRDLTFRELVIWYLEGRYIQDADFKYTFQKRHN